MTSSPADSICQFIPPFMRYLRDGLADAQISPARFQILQALDAGGAVTMISLADRLSVTKRNITTLVDGLEKDGLAYRKPHPTDRRSTLVELTAEGASVFARAASAQREQLTALLGHLEPDQRLQMATALTRLTQTIIAENQLASKAGKSKP